MKRVTKCTAILFASLMVCAGFFSCSDSGDDSGNGNGQIDYNKIYQEKLASGDLQGAITAQLMGAQQNAQ